MVSRRSDTYIINKILSTMMTDRIERMLVQAFECVEDENYSVEIIDLRTIVPLDEETIFTSVKKTNKVILKCIEK